MPIPKSFTKSKTTPLETSAQTGTHISIAAVSYTHLDVYKRQVQVEGDGYGVVMNNILNGAVDMDTAFADLNKRYNAAIEKGVAEGEFKIEDYMNANYSTLNPSGE